MRRLWEAFRRGGLDDALALVDEEVEWIPDSSQGVVLCGSEQVRAHFEALRGAGSLVEPVAHSFEPRGDAVLVSGTLRRTDPAGLSEANAFWVYWIAGGRLTRAQSFRSRRQAERAIRERQPRLGDEPGPVTSR